MYGRLYTKYETSISEVDTYVEAKDGSVYSKGGEVIVPASRRIRQKTSQELQPLINQGLYLVEI